MKHQLIFYVVFCLIARTPIKAQGENPNFYIGVSYGPSLALGDFRSKEVDNQDAGFAENGKKIDLYGGYFISEKVTLTGIFRYQFFDTDISNIVDEFNAQNPEETISISSEDWKTYGLMIGVAYEVNVSKKYDFFPRLGLGPLLVTNPSINAILSRGADNEVLDRKSETELGLGYEAGIGLQRKLGKNLTLLPMFTFSGGVVSISDVDSSSNATVDSNTYRPKITSFNFGLSVAYRFY